MTARVQRLELPFDRPLGAVVLPLFLQVSHAARSGVVGPPDAAQHGFQDVHRDITDAVAGPARRHELVRHTFGTRLRRPARPAGPAVSRHRAWGHVWTET